LAVIGPGTRLLHYRLDEKIGEGGMGVVWRATDTSLDREVAIKILPEAFARESDRLMRFEREAKLLATLNHPNIATVHGLHEADGVRFLAMELASGEDLAQRLSRGPLAAEASLQIALQVAEALEAAHESGVVHRDLKPANIQVDAEGKVKVLDFGLAKAFEEDAGSGSADPALSPTMTSAGTLAGVILGTAAYMSPEQAKGMPVDKRADVWAFGCVLLEMLTGRQTFRGQSVAETLASVIKEPPEWDRMPPGTPGRIRRLLRRCLVKDPRQRLRDIGDARIAIAEVLAGQPEESEDRAPAPPPRFARALPWSLTAALAIALAAVLVSRGPASTPEGTSGSARLSIVFPEERPMVLANLDLEVMPAFAVSPGGDRVVYSASEEPGRTLKGGGERALRVRPIDGFDAEVVRGTEGAEGPFYSPDGRWIGFFDGNALNKVPAAGGARVPIAEGIGNGIGADWGPDGTIVFAHAYVGPLWRVPESGGEPEALTTLADGERNHRYPQLLPDGRSVLFTIKTAGILSFDDAKIGIADVRSGEHRVLLDGGMYARYVAGHLVYARDGGLLAAPFDLDSLSITGGAVPVLDGVITNPVTGTAQFDFTPGGTLFYIPGDYRSGPTALYRVERETGAHTRLAEGHYVSTPRLSPDGRRLVLHGSSANDQVIALDIERDTVTRMTDALTNNILPIWGPRGERIVYTTDRTGKEEVVSIPADGGPVESLVPPLAQRQDAYSWSPDGDVLMLNVGSRASRDIWRFDVQTAEAQPFLATAFDEGDPVFTPDGKWIAYSSDESGRLEIYATPFPGPGGKIQLSTGGGYFPRFREDGRELFYQTESAIVAVPVTWSPGPRPGRPQVVFETGVLASGLGFDVSRDGELFYVVELDESRWLADRIDVVQGWVDELERLVSE
jgi:serine/threonine-protein kinase